MGAVKGEPHDEEVPTPTAQQAADAAAALQAAEADAASQQPQTTLEEVPIDGGAAAGDGAHVQRLVLSQQKII